jgi:hypothetical protein
MTTPMVQAVQANLYCPRSSLFSEWKRRRKEHNKETPGPPGPVNENRTCDTVRGESQSKRTPGEPGPPTGTRCAIVPSEWVSIPLEQCIFDPLYLGLAGLTGKVPDGWSRDGWVMSLQDRLTRTNDPVIRRRLRAELRACIPSPQGGNRAPLRPAGRAGARTPAQAPRRLNAANTAWAWATA